MISTPIGMSIQSQMPILYPQSADTQTAVPRPDPTRTDLMQNVAYPTPYPINLIQPDPTQTPYIYSEAPENKVAHSELYADYLTNPYSEIKDVTKEATLYDPEDPKNPEQNPLLAVLDKKSFSANTTPMHSTNKAQFGSSDNVRQDSGMFNFSSYFGSVSEAIGPGSEVFDTLMSTQEG